MFGDTRFSTAGWTDDTTDLPILRAADCVGDGRFKVERPFRFFGERNVKHTGNLLNTIRRMNRTEKCKLHGRQLYHTLSPKLSGKLLTYRTFCPRLRYNARAFPWSRNTMPVRCLFTLLLVCSCLTLGTAQETETEPVNTLYEAVVFPDRTLSRRLEQADRLFETGRDREAAQLLGGILESADAVFLMPEESAEETRTLRLTIDEYIIDRIRKMPREARDSYAFQFEPTAKRLLENAVANGSLDDVQQVARKYFPTSSGASATFLVALTQFERGDYAAASLSFERLKRQHPALPDSLETASKKMLEELQNRLQNGAEQPPQGISEPTWLEQIGWRIPSGSPSQNANTAATTPLLEQNWSVPTFSQLFQEREIDSITQVLKSNSSVYIPASQPLLVGDLLITRTFGETIAVDANTGKRLWAVAESEYRFPEKTSVTPLASGYGYNPRTTFRFFYWHDRIAQQLSSDGERFFCIDGHSFQIDAQRLARQPNLPGRREEDLRFEPGSTLTARDRKTGRILWQVGKFPYVQKYIDIVYSTPVPRGQQGPIAVDETLFTDDEKTFKNTWFLGAPLPLHNRLYVIGETDGILQLFVLESQTGRLIAKQTFAQAQTSLTSSLVRRAYPLFPSASGGIVLCPSGTGLVTALDATTLSPIWCFSYAPAQTNSPTNRRIMNQRRIMPTASISEQDIMQIFAESGWQVPRIIIDGQRVLVAPPDRPALYCLDLLSGKLQWEKTISRANALYVACIQNDKAFVVTPTSLTVFGMNKGEEIASHKIVFPSALKPAGVGVHSGNQYFIPFTDGQLAIADLNEGKLVWNNASGETIPPPVEESVAKTDDDSYSSSSDEPQPPRVQIIPMGPMIPGGGFGASFAGNRFNIFSPDLATKDIFQQSIRFGNLVGIKGRFFSQSPTQITSFDQKESLRQRAQASLDADPNDPDGLLKQGRVLRAEGKLTEAIESFRASMRTKPTPEAADALRRNLLEAMRKDYPTWADAGLELESLAIFPDEWGIILYAQIEGILQSGTPDDLVPILERVFAFGYDHTILIPVNNDYSVQLHRALGGLFDKNVIAGNRSAWRTAWEEIAESLFQRLSENSDGLTKPSHIVSFPDQWIQNTVFLPHKIQRWSMFVHLFRHTQAAEKAKQLLLEEYVNYNLSPALNLQEKSSTTLEWSELSVPFAWNSGIVEMQHTPAVINDRSTQINADGNEMERHLNRLLAVAKNPDVSRMPGNQQPIPFLGAADSEPAKYNYVISPWTMNATDVFLCCNDPFSGEERWRLALSRAKYLETWIMTGYAAGYTQGGIEHSLYIKGHNNFLLLVLGNSIVGIDISSPSEAKFLWSKTLTSVLESKQTSRDRGVEQRLSTNMMFPKNSVFVSPHVVCIWDANCVYGLEPLTGHTLWVRKTLHDNCSIIGDDDSLFLIFPDAKQVLAVDPASGKELENGRLPVSTVYYVYKTNIIFAQKIQGDDYALHVSDLRDMSDRRSRALQIANLVDEQLTSSVRSDVLHSRVNRGVTFVQMLGGDRFLSVANWGTKSLQIHDLQTKKKLLPDGNTMLRFVSEGNMGSTMRCDVEFVEDRFLVLFTKNVHIKPMEPPRRVTYSQVQGVPSMPIDTGEMMLFDTEGNPCWSEPTKVDTTFRLIDVPDRLPVMLFAVARTNRDIAKLEDPDSEDNYPYSTRIMAVDKRSGEFRFRKSVLARNPSLQMFRVTSDAQSQTITFSTPNTTSIEVVKAVFTDKKPEE